MFHKRRLVAPINTIKHYVSQTNTFVAANAIANLDIIEAVTVAAAGSATNDVQEGSLVKTVFIELWIFNAGATTTTTQFDVTVEKVPAGATAMTFAQAANLMTYPNKKNILFTSQGVLPANIDGSGAVPILRNWLKIPRGKQRFGLGDKLTMNVSTIGQNLRMCSIETYKEWT